MMKILLSYIPTFPICLREYWFGTGEDTDLLTSKKKKKKNKVKKKVTNFRFVSITLSWMIKKQSKEKIKIMILENETSLISPWETSTN